MPEVEDFPEAAPADFELDSLEDEFLLLLLALRTLLVSDFGILVDMVS